MRNPPFDFSRLSLHDCDIASRVIGSLYTPPDLIIAPDGGEYLYRWYVIPRNPHCNVYFHIQMASDPERPLHDHPWDNTSHILAGGYTEIINVEPDAHGAQRHVTYTVKRHKGDVIHRPATWAHRLILPQDVAYTMSVFTTGPKVRKWGFWEDGKFTPYQEVTVESAGHSTWKNKGSMA